MLKEGLGSLLRRRYNIYSLSPGMLRSVYCPPIPQCWCLIFRTSILPRDLRHQPRNTPPVQNPRASPIRAEGRRALPTSLPPWSSARAGTYFISLGFLDFKVFFYISIGEDGKRGLLWREKKSTMSATFPGLVHDAEVINLTLVNVSI